MKLTKNRFWIGGNLLPMSLRGIHCRSIDACLARQSEREAIALSRGSAGKIGIFMGLCFRHTFLHTCRLVVVASETGKVG